MTDDFGGSSTKNEKLNDSKFHAWKQNLVLILALKDFDEYIEDNRPTDQAVLDKWVKNDRKSRAIIVLSLSDEHFEHARDVDTPRKCGRRS